MSESTRPAEDHDGLAAPETYAEIRGLNKDAAAVRLAGMGAVTGREAASEQQTVTTFVPRAMTPREYLRVIADGADAMPVLDISGYPQLRVSGSVILRFRVRKEDGTEAVLLTYSDKYKQFAQFGGAIELKPDYRAALVARGMVPDGNDMRFDAVTPAQALELTEMFLREQGDVGENIEGGPECGRRELREEATEEYPVATADQLDDLSFGFMGYAVKLAPDAKDRMTLYLARVYDVPVTSEAVASSIIAKAEKNPKVALVPEAEILSRIGNGVEPLAASVVQPLPELPRIKAE